MEPNSFLYDYVIIHIYTMCVLSHFISVQLCVTLWTVAYKAPLSIGFSRQETGMGWHALLHGIFLTQGSNPCPWCLLHWQVGSLLLAPPGKPYTICMHRYCIYVNYKLTLATGTGHLLQGLNYILPQLLIFNIPWK